MPNYKIVDYYREFKTSKTCFISIKLLFIFCQYSGLRAIWWKINPPENTSTRKPASFVLWFAGIYFALYGVALQLHENKLSKIEMQINTIIAHTSNKDTRGFALSQLPSIQRLEAPIRPELFQPSTVLISLFGKQLPNAEIIHKSKTIFAIWKNELNNLYLYGVDLSGMPNLEKSNFVGTNLTKANFTGSNLTNSNFTNSNLTDVNFANSNLTNATLDMSCPSYTNFSHSIMLDTKLRNIDSLSCSFFIDDNNRYALYNIPPYHKVNVTKDDHDASKPAKIDGYEITGNFAHKFIKGNETMTFEETFYYYDIRNPNLFSVDEKFTFGKILHPLCTNFSHAYLIRTDFSNTDTTNFIFWGSNLEFAKITQDQIFRSKTLYESTLNKNDFIAVSHIRPELFTIPNSIFKTVYKHGD